jgi:broad specificity phosphatase PhoE
MPTLLVIRHAQASFGAANYDELSPVGVEQSRALAADLRARGVSPSRIVTGSLRRQQDTIAPFADGLAAPVTDDRWNEYHADEILAAYSDTSVRLSAPGGGSVDPSDFQDLLDAALLKWIVGPTPAGVESWLAFSMRVEAAAKELLGSLASGETAVVCASGGVVAALCAGMLGLRGSGFLSFNRVCANTAVTTIIRGRRGDSLVSFNEQGHLGRPGGPPLTYR